MANEAHDLILNTCRGVGGQRFRASGQWGMRTDVALNGYRDPDPRVPCAVIDLARTKPHPTRYGFSVPLVLASGDTWEAVLSQLQASGEV